MPGLRRNRAPVKGGYRRVTISIPETLSQDLDRYLETKSGLTTSALITETVKKFLDKTSIKA